MSLRGVKKYFIAHMVARVIYLFSATIMCVGMILVIIMVANILLPYLRVRHYLPANCTHVSTVVANIQDCDKCPRLSTSVQPCIQVMITYQYQNVSGMEELITALLKDNEYNVINDTDETPCTYKTQYTAFYWQNENAVERFRREYGQAGSRYPCLYDPAMPYRVIVSRDVSDGQALHAMLWPSLAFLLGLVLVIIFYCWVGCDIWGNRIATVTWDKSLKRIEMEQEIRKRTNNNTRNNYRW